MRPVLKKGHCRRLRLSLCMFMCVWVSVNHKLVCAITPNLSQKCELPWLKSLLFRGIINLDLQGQIGFEIEIPHFELVIFSAR